MEAADTILEKKWSIPLSLLSYLVAVLGAYTTTQIFCIIVECKRLARKLLWLALASVTLGGCGIFSMHFVGVLAMDIGIEVSYDIPLTVLSFIVAVTFTFLTLAADDLFLVLSRLRTYIKHGRHHSSPFRSALFDPNGRYQQLSSDSNGPRDEEAGLENGSAPVGGSSSSSRPSFGSEGDLFGEELRRTHSDDTHMWVDRWGGSTAIGRLFWKFWMSCTFLVVFKGLTLALAFASMHYIGMYAMIMEARITWNPWWILASLLDVWFICIVAFIFMPLEVNLVSQFIFSLVCGFGSALMHYTGMFAATFHTWLPPPYNKGGYPLYLAFLVTSAAFASCFLSYILLANSVTESRNRLADMIHTKRSLWKVMAEKEAAERANRVKTEFINVASHEIRTPLHSIFGYTELLSQTPLTQDQQSYVKAIKNGCDTIQLITNNVLDFTKLERGNAESVARPVECDLRKLAENVVRSCAPKQRVGVDLICWVREGVPETVFLDEIYLTRVLMNLVSNALKFTSCGYVLLLCEAETDSDGKAMLVLTVRDTGIGIPSESLGVIFEPFRQADTSLTRKHTGTGLGLAICKQLIALMQGTIGVDSTVGTGSSFTIRIPIHTSSVVPSPSSVDASRNQHPKPSLALFSRHPKTFELLHSTFTQLGYLILTSGDDCADVGKASAALASAWGVVGDGEVLISDGRVREEVMKGGNGRNVVVMYDEGEGLARFEEGVAGEVRPVIVHSLEEHLRGVRKKIPPDVVIDLHSNEAVGVEKKERTVHFNGVGGKDVGGVVGSPPWSEGRARILLVEDNLINQKLGQKLLEKLSYNTTLASDGLEAIQLIESSPTFDVVLMDCQMPILSGTDATRRIREMEKASGAKRRLPIIALTANVSEDSKEECRLAGMDMFLPKPLRMKDLEEAIGRFLGGGEVGSF